ncbi:MAG: FkbM family methyltransferase [Salibacteraceae bacterium]
MYHFPKYFRRATDDAAIYYSARSGTEYHHPKVEGQIVVDVGAHIGGFTEYALQHGAVGVHAFEANAANFDYLQRNCGHHSNAYLNQAALWWSNKDQLRSCPVSRKNTGGAFLKHASEAQVPLITLPDYLQAHQLSHIDLLKLDCEGSEFPILYSLPPEVLRNIKRILGEFHNGYAAQLFHYDHERQPHINFLLPYLTAQGFRCTLLRTGSNGLGIFEAKRVGA